MLIRSATKLDADLIAKADRLRAVGRAGVGVDNVDVDAATKRGIIVANAPQSNVITAAEHTVGMLLALARNIPQAHSALVGGAWDRSKYSGTELYEKTLGVIGFGRIGQLVAQRALSFGMRVIAFDLYVGEERFQEAGVERAETSDELYAAADFITIHLPVTPETENWLNAEAFAKMKDGVRVINVARGKLVVDDDLKAALDSGKVGGAALDVFRDEPATDAPAVRLPERRRHPAPGRVHRRGHRPRRLPGRRAGGGRAHRRRRDDGGERSVGGRRGHGGARPVPAAVGAARPRRRRARGRAGGRARGRVPRPDRRARHAPADGAGAEGGARRATPRRTSTTSTRPGSRPSAGSRWPRRAARRRATSPTSCA